MHTLYLSFIKWNINLIGFQRKQTKIYYDENNEFICDYKHLINLKFSYVYALTDAD